METYEVIFKSDETTGVYGISLVDNPAMESMFVALKKETKVELSVLNAEKRLLLGAVLIPNKPIYRKEGNKEFNIIFPKETVQLALTHFQKNGYQNSSTLEHDTETPMKDVTFVENWIKLDDVKDKSVMYNRTEPIGTWFTIMKAHTQEAYDLALEKNGFSIDGFFDLKKVKLSKNQTLKGIDIWFENTMLQKGDLVTKLSGENLEDGEHDLMTELTITVKNGIVMDMKEINLKSEIQMSEEKKDLGDLIVDAIKQGFAKISMKKEIKLGAMKTSDGNTVISFDGDTIGVGTDVYMTSESGEKLPVSDGEYPMEDGSIWVITSSKVSEVKQKEGDNTELENQTTTAPSVKSEKVTTEVFYQLSKEDKDWIENKVETSILALSNTLALELGSQLESKVLVIKTELSKEEAVVELTKNKPAETKPFEEMTALEKFRATK